MPVVLVMVFSAFSGAAAVVNGVLDPARQIKLETLDTGIFGSLLTNGVVGIVAFLVLGAAALLLPDPRRRPDRSQSIDRSAYRY